VSPAGDAERNKQGIAIVIVVAVAENGVIGRDNTLPWHLRSDMKHFRALTINKPVVMGRKTYLSIGKPLKDRTNIIVSRDLSLVLPGCVTAMSIDAALASARDDARKRGVNEIMVIGGRDVFAATLPMASRLEVTHVHAAPEGDVFFPPIDPDMWREAARTEYPKGPDDDAAFAIATYERR
jgi:dihydrofolate reductase